MTNSSQTFVCFFFKFGQHCTSIVVVCRHSFENVRLRLLSKFTNEAVMCLQENIIANPVRCVLAGDLSLTLLYHGVDGLIYLLIDWLIYSLWLIFAVGWWRCTCLWHWLPRLPWRFVVLTIVEFKLDVMSVAFVRSSLGPLVKLFSFRRTIPICR